MTSVEISHPASVTFSYTPHYQQCFLADGNFLKKAGRGAFLVLAILLAHLVDSHHQPVFVACNVEHYAPVFEHACIAKILLHLGSGCSICFQSMSVPGQCRIFLIHVSRVLCPVRFSDIDYRVVAGAGRLVTGRALLLLWRPVLEVQPRLSA